MTTENSHRKNFVELYKKEKYCRERFFFFDLPNKSAEASTSDISILSFRVSLSKASKFFL